MLTCLDLACMQKMNQNFEQNQDVVIYENTLIHWLLLCRCQCTLDMWLGILWFIELSLLCLIFVC